MYFNFKLQKQLSVYLVIKLSTADLLFICLQFRSNEQSRADRTPGLLSVQLTNFPTALQQLHCSNKTKQLKWLPKRCKLDHNRMAAIARHGRHMWVTGYC